MTKLSSNQRYVFDFVRVFSSFQVEIRLLWKRTYQSLGSVFGVKNKKKKKLKFQYCFLFVESSIILCR